MQQHERMANKSDHDVCNPSTHCVSLRSSSGRFFCDFACSVSGNCANAEIVRPRIVIVEHKRDWNIEVIVTLAFFMS